MSVTKGGMIHDCCEMMCDYDAPRLVELMEKNCYIQTTLLSMLNQRDRIKVGSRCLPVVNKCSYEMISTDKKSNT